MTRLTRTGRNAIPVSPASRSAVVPQGWRPHPWTVPALHVDSPTRWLVTGAVGPVAEDGAVLHESDVTAQVALSVENLATVLAGCGMDLADVLRVAVSTVDLPAVSAELHLIGERFCDSGCRPALSVVGVAELPLSGALLVLDAIAAA